MIQPAATPINLLWEAFAAGKYVAKGTMKTITTIRAFSASRGFSSAMVSRASVEGKRDEEKAIALDSKYPRAAFNQTLEKADGGNSLKTRPDQKDEAIHRPGIVKNMAANRR